MPPRQSAKVRPAAPLHPSKREKKEKQTDADATSLVLKVAAGVSVLIGILFYMLYEDYSTCGSLNQFFRDQGYTIGSFVDVVFERKPWFGGLDYSHSELVARSRVPAGTPLFTVPASQLIEMSVVRQSALGRLLSYENGTYLSEALEPIGLMNSPAFYLAMFLVYEHRRGAESVWANWLATIPQTHTGGAASWPEAVGDCLDDITKSEYLAIQKAPEAALKAAQAVCSVPPEAASDPVCQGVATNPFTQEEIHRMIHFYFRAHFQDMVIVPGLHYAHRSLTPDAIYPRASVQEGSIEQIEVVRNENTKSGDILTRAFLRGPGSQLALYGSFDRAHINIELPVRLPQAKKGSFLYKACIEQSHRLTLQKDGRPNPILLKCVAGLLAKDKEQRKEAAHVMRHPEMRMYVLSNLTVIASRMKESLRHRTASCQPALEKIDDAARAEIVAYRVLISETIDANLAYMMPEVDRLAGKLGVLSPLELLRQQSAQHQEQQQHQQQDGDIKTSAGSFADLAVPDDEESKEKTDVN